MEGECVPSLWTLEAAVPLLEWLPPLPPLHRHVLSSLEIPSQCSHRGDGHHACNTSSALVADTFQNKEELISQVFLSSMYIWSHCVSCQEWDVFSKLIYLKNLENTLKVCSYNKEFTLIFAFKSR